MSKISVIIPVYKVERGCLGRGRREVEFSGSGTKEREKDDIIGETYERW